MPVLCGVSAYSLFWVCDIAAPATFGGLSRDSYSARAQEKEQLTMQLEPKFYFLLVWLLQDKGDSGHRLVW